MKRAVQSVVLAVLLSISSNAQEEGKFSILAYADYFYNIQSDSAVTNVVLPGPEDFHGFRFRRIYLTYDYTIDAAMSSRFRLEADESALTSDGKTGMFVKDAYLKWKRIFGNSDLTFGIQPTPAFQVSESYWGYRSLEKTIMDLRGMVGSRDFGISLKGSVDPGGKIGYWVFLGNGSGNRPEQDKFKRYYGLVSVEPFVGMVVTFYGDYNARADIENPFTGGRSSNSTMTSAVFAGVVPADELRIGVEAAVHSTENGFNTGTALASRNRLGISGFARWRVSDGLEVVGRYDYFDQNMHSSAKGDTRGYLIAGAAWSAAQNVRIIPNIQIETIESTPERSVESSVVGRLTLEWSTP